MGMPWPACMPCLPPCSQAASYQPNTQAGGLDRPAIPELMGQADTQGLAWKGGMGSRTEPCSGSGTLFRLCLLLRHRAARQAAGQASSMGLLFAQRQGLLPNWGTAAGRLSSSFWAPACLPWRREGSPPRSPTSPAVGMGISHFCHGGRAGRRAGSWGRRLPAERASCLPAYLGGRRLAVLPVCLLACLPWKGQGHTHPAPAYQTYNLIYRAQEKILPAVY